MPTTSDDLAPVIRLLIGCAVLFTAFAADARAAVLPDAVSAVTKTATPVAQRRRRS